MSKKDTTFTAPKSGNYMISGSADYTIKNLHTLIFEQKVKHLELLPIEELIFMLNSYKKYGDVTCYIKASKIIQEKLGKLAEVLYE